MSTESQGGSPERTLRIKLVRSPIGHSERHKRTVRALGLRKLHQEVVHRDTPAIRGMIRQVQYLLAVTES
jgi:large subunit ribosomal protein L30